MINWNRWTSRLNLSKDLSLAKIAVLLPYDCDTAAPTKLDLSTSSKARHSPTTPQGRILLKACFGLTTITLIDWFPLGTDQD